MTIKQRIELLVKLGEYFVLNNEELQAIKLKAQQRNAWFDQTFIDFAIKNITENFLQKDLLEKWIDNYNLKDEPHIKTVGIIMAGNIPLVGFHDFLCVFISAHKALIKPSSKDEVLIKHIVDKFLEWNNETNNYIAFAENLKNCNAYIATGSNNSSRYFEYYFAKYPNIIRCNRTSIAVLEGNETAEELSFLADDIQTYYGLGCRNITKLFVPEDYNFAPLLNALKKYNYFTDFHKYKNNYDYQLTLLIMNQKLYMSNDSILLTENEGFFSPVSQVNYSYYASKTLLEKELSGNQNVQCIEGHDYIPFGKSQTPSLMDYADGKDIMQFLREL